MSAALKEIQDALRMNASKEAMAAQVKFLPGVTKSYGVYMPVINDLAKQYKTGGFDLIEQLWQAGHLEEKMIAAKILGCIAKKDPQRSLRLVEKFAGLLEDWSVCDTLGMQSLKPLRKTHQREIFALAGKLSKASDSWQRRLALVLVEWYTRDASTHEVINELLYRLQHDEAYYVQKAITWIKRNLRKHK